MIPITQLSDLEIGARVGVTKMLSGISMEICSKNIITFFKSGGVTVIGRKKIQYILKKCGRLSCRRLEGVRVGVSSFLYKIFRYIRITRICNHNLS